MHTALQLLKENQRMQSRFLDLGNCGLTDMSYEVWSELQYMHWVEHLNLGEWFWGEWGYRDSTRNRGLRNNLHRIPNEITLLYNLKGMYLHDNPIHDLFPLLGLQQLTFLDLSYTRLYHLQHLGNLPRLQKLSLMGIEVQDFTQLKYLLQLRELLLANATLTDLSPISGLTHLTLLSLNDSTVPDLNALRPLKKLTYLYLRNTQLQDYSPLKDLETLFELDLSENDQLDLSCIEHLKKLERLGLNRMKINPYPESFFTHTSIKELYTAETTIAEVPPELLSKREGENCYPRIKDYHLSRQQGSEQVREAKLIVVGNGRVGKTCIIDALLGNEFESDEKSTHGIHLSVWDELKIEGNPATINIWDFAGQDIYHATHQLFMRTRALYLLVWDAESEQSAFHEYEGYQYQNHPIIYWLEYINRISGGAPIILVQNKTDRDGKQSPPTIAELQRKYPIIDILEVSARTRSGMRKLTVALEEALTELPEVKQAPVLPHSWQKVKQRLAQSDQPSISQEVYQSICHQSGITPTDHHIPQSLLEYLHHTGFLFHQKGLFNDQIILDQSWIIQAVYTLFDREGIYFDLLVAKEGVFHQGDLTKIWHQHSEKEHRLFLSFMEQCEICFPLDWGTYVIPQLMSETPSPIVQRFWDRDQGGDVFVKMTYPFLHRSIVDRFLVRIGRLAKEEEVWRNGIWWRDPWINTDAWVEFELPQTPELTSSYPYQGKLICRLRGDQPKAMLERIRRELERIVPEQTSHITVSPDGKNSLSLETLIHAQQAQMNEVLSIEGNKVRIDSLTALIVSPKTSSQSLPTGGESSLSFSLRQMVEAAQLEKVLTQLKPFTINTDHNNQIYQLLSRLSNLEINKDRIDSRDYRVEWNRISYSCLMIIEGLEGTGKLSRE